MNRLRDEFDGLGNSLAFGERPALLVVDVQNGMTNPDHPIGADLSEMIPPINRLLEGARTARIPVIFTVISSLNSDHLGPLEEKAPGLRSFTPNSKWTDVDPRVNIEDSDIVVEKHHQSAFHGTDLNHLLQELDVDTLIVTGCSTSGCVRATVTDASAHGYRPFIPREAVSDRSPEQHRANLVDMDVKLADVRPLEEILGNLESTDGDFDA